MKGVKPKLVTCGSCETKFNYNNYLTDELLNRPSREAVLDINYDKLRAKRKTHKLKVICTDCVVKTLSQPSQKILVNVAMKGK